MGCGKIISYCEQEQHKKECTYMEGYFRCNLCKIKVFKIDKDAHRKKCEFLKTRCLLCDEAINIIDCEDHLKNSRNE